MSDRGPSERVALLLANRTGRRSFLARLGAAGAAVALGGAAACSRGAKEAARLSPVPTADPSASASPSPSPSPASPSAERTPAPSPVDVPSVAPTPSASRRTRKEIRSCPCQARHSQLCGCAWDTRCPPGTCVSGYWVCCGTSESTAHCGDRMAVFQDCCKSGCTPGRSECGETCRYRGYCNGTGCRKKNCGGESRVWCVWAYCADAVC